MKSQQNNIRQIENSTEKTKTETKIPANPNKNSQKPKELTIEQAEKALEDLKLKLNEEMMGVLDEEQAKDQARDEEIEKIQNEKVRDEKEKEHGFDRAKAQKRIQELAEKHEKALKVFKKKNKL
jgi:hypothetical protein